MALPDRASAQREKAMIEGIMIEHIAAGIILALGFLCLILPALHALAGPDEDERVVSKSWRREHR